MEERSKLVGRAGRHEISLLGLLLNFVGVGPPAEDGPISSCPKRSCCCHHSSRLLDDQSQPRWYCTAVGDQTCTLLTFIVIIYGVLSRQSAFEDRQDLKDQLHTTFWRDWRWQDHSSCLKDGQHERWAGYHIASQFRSLEWLLGGMGYPLTEVDAWSNNRYHNRRHHSHQQQRRPVTLL